MPSPTDDNLLALLSPVVLRRLAGETSFARGRRYAHDGRVRSLRELDDAVEATVKGAALYRVRLWADGVDLGWSCTCPVGTDGECCKHVVATALRWRAREGTTDEEAAPPDDLRARLEKLPPSVLADILIEQALDDDALFARLLVRAEGTGTDTSHLRAAIDRVVPVRGFIPYHDAYAYSVAIHEVIEAIGDHLEAGFAEDAIELCEYGLACVEEAIGSVDDSDGHLAEIFSRLQEIHHAACLRARPDPATLAQTLFTWEIRTDWDTFYDAVETYADVLGSSGLAVYRELAQKQWAHVAAIGPNDDDPERYGNRFRITHIMEKLAELSGDVEEMLEVRRRDQSHPQAFLDIAELLHKSDRTEEGLAWAERGVEAFGAGAWSDLTEFVAGAYQNAGRHAEAMGLAWQFFVARPGLDRFRTLKDHADRAGDWPDWRKRALSHMREVVALAKRSRKAETSRWLVSDNSDLVSIFLWERDVDAAWLEAQQGGCVEGLWMELGRLREAEHPADALSVYKTRVGPMVDRANNQAYAEAVELLRKCQELLHRLGHADEFPRYVEAVRKEHGRKRNFMKLLAHEGWA